MNFCWNRDKKRLFLPNWVHSFRRTWRSRSGRNWSCFFFSFVFCCIQLRAAEIGDTAGQAEVYDSLLSSWKSVKQGWKLIPGQTVRTGLGGFMELRLRGKRYIRLAESSMVGMNAVDENDFSRQITLSLTRGRIWVSVLSRKINRGTMKIRTPVALVAVKGTQVDAVFRQTSKELQLAVLSGSIEVTQPEMIEGPEVVEEPREIQAPLEITREEWLILVESGNLFSISSSGEPSVVKAGREVLENDWVVSNQQRDLLIMKK